MNPAQQHLTPSKWVESYSDMLFNYVVMRVKDAETARDMVQETFLSALKTSDRFRGEISEKNWLFTILKNKIIDHYRSRARTLLVSINESISEADNFFDENGMWKPAAAPSVWNADYSSSIERKEFFEVLEKCRNKLTELQNIVFSMKYFDEKKSEEICKELELSSSNYWVLIHRSKLKLRQCLEKNWFAA